MSSSLFRSVSVYTDHNQFMHLGPHPCTTARQVGMGAAMTILDALDALSSGDFALCMECVDRERAA